VGGAAVAIDTPGLNVLEDRRDLAVLWTSASAPTCGPRYRDCPAQACGGLGQAARLHPAQDRDPERQRSGLPFLRRPGLYSGRYSPLRLRRLPPVAHEAMLLWYLDL